MNPNLILKTLLGMYAFILGFLVFFTWPILLIALVYGLPFHKWLILIFIYHGVSIIITWVLFNKNKENLT